MKLGNIFEQGLGREARFETRELNFVWSMFDVDRANSCQTDEW